MIVDQNKPACELTTNELISVLADRCPTIIVAAHVPTDNNCSETRLSRCGNRAAQVGLAWMLLKECKKAMYHE